MKRYTKKMTKCINEDSKNYNISNTNEIKDWSPENFKMETTSLWSFPARGNWATHKNSYRGNWSPYIPRNIILRYSKEGDIILDQFLGSGTTLIEAKLLKRIGIGVDINPKAITLSSQNINFSKENCIDVQLYQNDARDLYFIKDNSIDLICTHPPYSNIIRYSEGIEGDLSHLDVNEFLVEMKSVATESYRVLKKDKFCAILIGDVRRKNNIIPLGFGIMELFRNTGFILKEIIIKQQHNCHSTNYWMERSKIYNFLLIAHEYLFIFKK